jgi:hypothetical protein
VTGDASFGSGIPVLSVNVLTPSTDKQKDSPTAQVPRILNNARARRKRRRKQAAPLLFANSSLIKFAQMHRAFAAESENIIPCPVSLYTPQNREVHKVGEFVLIFTGKERRE